jgi:hypothetical protein
LEVTSTTPVPGAADVDPLATVAVEFNQAINPATLTTAALRVTQNAIPLATGLTWDGPTQTARAPAPLLPGETYQVEVTTDVKTPAGTALVAAETWSFTTRVWQAVWIGTDLAQGPSLTQDQTGRVHVAYFDATSGSTLDLKYATCGAACTVPANWQVVAVDTAGLTGETPSLAVDAGGRIHIAHRSIRSVTSDFSYSTCGASCTVPANWQTVTVDTGLTGQDETIYLFYSLAVGTGGRLHVVYADDLKRDLKYGTCAASCTIPANWQLVYLDTMSAGPGTLALDDAGGVHVVYIRGTQVSPTLHYAACATGCGTPGNWQLGGGAAVPAASAPSMVTDGTGGVHAVFALGATAGFGYARCYANCTAAVNWIWGSASPGVQAGAPRIAVDADQRVHVFYGTGAAGTVRYSTCVVNCAAGPSTWRTTEVDAESVAGPVSLAFGADGRVRLAYGPTGPGGPGFRYSE